MRALQRVLFPAVLAAALWPAGCLQSKTDTNQSGKTQNNANDEDAGKSLAPGERRVSGSGGIVGVVTRRVENYHELIKKKPHLKVKEKATGGTLLSNAYLSAVSRLSVSQFEHNLRLYRELNGGKWPTYDEYMKKMKQFQVELAKLPPWLYYAYDEKTGRLLILEDTQKKQRAYQQ